MLREGSTQTMQTKNLGIFFIRMARYLDSGAGLCADMIGYAERNGRVESQLINELKTQAARQLGDRDKFSTCVFLT